MSMKQIVNFSDMESISSKKTFNATLKTMILEHPLVQKMLDTIQRSNSGSQSVSLFTPGAEDPLDLIDEIFSQYIETQTAHADAMAQQIEVMSNAVAEINRLWGLVMQETQPNTDLNSNDKTPLLGDDYLEQIDSYIKDDLGDSRGISVITGSNLEDTKNMSVSYVELNEMEASMTAYGNSIQVDLDTKQQEFKNVMTQISSTQDEIRNVRRAIVAITQG
ncbi:hypothetical protein [Vibrio sp. CUB2]|uniref:hypothetical protein n=1 Tax=Vibrio sp. CUB2 TaxID=2315233 RepID=UPI000B33E9E5|nr:hypothetical protein [Vibrio sp. CUB2]